MNEVDKKRLNNCKQIERELRLKNAELSMEIEKSRMSESILRESCQILTLVSEISKDIVEKAMNLDVDIYLEKIGKRLTLNKIFLVRFSNKVEPYTEWYSDIFHCSQTFDQENEDITLLMNWVYEKKSFSGKATDLPKFFNFVSCPKLNDDQCTNCNIIIVPLIINKKPWGLMGYTKDTSCNAANLTTKAIVNLSNLLAILIREKEENEQLSSLIDSRLIGFKKQLREMRDIS